MEPDAIGDEAVPYEPQFDARWAVGRFGAGDAGTG